MGIIKITMQQDFPPYVSLLPGGEAGENEDFGFSCRPALPDGRGSAWAPGNWGGVSRG